MIDKKNIIWLGIDSEKVHRFRKIISTSSSKSTYFIIEWKELLHFGIDIHCWNIKRNLIISGCSEACRVVPYAVLLFRYAGTNYIHLFKVYPPIRCVCVCIFRSILKNRQNPLSRRCKTIPDRFVWIELAFAWIFMYISIDEPLYSHPHTFFRLFLFITRKTSGSQNNLDYIRLNERGSEREQDIEGEQVIKASRWRKKTTVLNAKILCSNSFLVVRCRQRWYWYHFAVCLLLLWIALWKR